MNRTHVYPGTMSLFHHFHANSAPTCYNLINNIETGSVADLDPVPFLPLDPGSGMGKNQDPDPGSCLRELRIFGLKILKFFDVAPELSSGIL